MPLKDIIAILPELTADELSVVIATASQLKAVKSGSAPVYRGNRGRARAQTSSGRKRGPSQQESAWKDVPEYQGFRSAEKEMKSLLKQKQKSLKEALSDPIIQDDPVLKRFQTAQAVWFRCKAELANPAASSSTGPPSETQRNSA